MRLRTVLIGAALVVIATGAQPPLVLVGAIALPGVQGRIDHLAIDVAGNRLMIAALGTGTLEIVDLRTRVRAHSVGGFREPQGVAIAPGRRWIAVADGENGELAILDASYRSVSRIAVGDDADNVRFDERLRRWYVGVGNDRGAIVALTLSGERVNAVQLNGHPESFQIEAAGPRLFVNVPATRHVVVVDRRSMTVLARWPVAGAAANFPMALDEVHNRLFIGCREPARVIAYDTRGGTPTASAETGGDADDLFYDAARKRLYVTAGAGFIDVFDAAPGTLRRVSRISTRSGARTSLYVPEHSRLYVALPRHDGHAASIEVFDARD